MDEVLEGEKVFFFSRVLRPAALSIQLSICLVLVTFPGEEAVVNNEWKYTFNLPCLMPAWWVQG
jgi:hypothetical protein